MKKAALHNLGCKVNAYELEAMQQQLEAGGYEIVPFEDRADVYIINTCTVTNIADRKSRQMLHRARKCNPDAVVVAAGCYVQAAEEDLKKDKTVDIVIGNNQKGKLLELLDEYMDGKGGGEAVLDIGHASSYESMRITRTSEHTRAFIKIQDGCNQFCSYCIIPYARGRIRSREAEDVLEEVAGLAAGGLKEAVLTGIHLSSYGADRQEENGLLELVMRLQEVEGIERIRLGSLEPRIITEEFVRSLSGLSKFCPHFHLSLQSGCNETLKRMNRHYTTGEYYEKCCLIREFFEHPAITTDVIAGFPGETEEEFEETLAFVKKVQFYEMHVFKYSRRKGTLAAKMEAQVPEQKKQERSRRLIDLAHDMSQDFRRYYIGRETQVLLEEPVTAAGENFLAGYNKEYVRCAFRAGTENTLISGTPAALTEDGLLLCENAAACSSR